jgi:hypothetical protein
VLRVLAARDRLSSAHKIGGVTPQGNGQTGQRVDRGVSATGFQRGVVAPVDAGEEGERLLAQIRGASDLRGK